MTAHDPEHDRLHDATGLYVLGALGPDERAEFERHAASCLECTNELRLLAGVATALPYGATQVDPPAGLRARVLAAAGQPAAARSNVAAFTPRPVRTSRIAARTGWLSAAALLLVAVGAGSYAWTLRGEIAALQGDLRDALTRLDRSERQATVATRNVAVAEGRLAVLLASDMTQVNLEGQPVAPGASGRAFMSRSRGLVFTASALPPAPAGRIYQLWVVTSQAPVSAGLLEVDASGTVAQQFPAPELSGAAPAAVAVTLEPAGGVPAPTGDKYLVGLTH
jgi:anti-sigma-K factor RskA